MHFFSHFHRQKPPVFPTRTLQGRTMDTLDAPFNHHGAPKCLKMAQISGNIRIFTPTQSFSQPNTRAHTKKTRLREGKSSHAHTPLHFPSPVSFIYFTSPPRSFFYLLFRVAHIRWHEVSRRGEKIFYSSFLPYKSNDFSANPPKHSSPCVFPPCQLLITH